MTYIENIFLCISVPIFLALFFIKGRARRFNLFVAFGMGGSLLAAYVSSFFMGYYGTDALNTAIEITPVCEEVMKMIPLLIYFLIFDPSENDFCSAAIAVAVGFTTFENICYLTENGADNFTFLLVRGISAGALHILCGVLSGYGISHLFRKRFLALTGTVGILGACTCFHAIYNLLITALGIWRTIGCLFPSLMLLCLFIVKELFPKIQTLWK